LILIDPSTPGYGGEPVCSAKELNDFFGGITASDIKGMDTDTRTDILLKVYHRICKGYVVKPYTGETILVLARNSRTVTTGWQQGGNYIYNRWRLS
jgi:hypothetical protein